MTASRARESAITQALDRVAAETGKSPLDRSALQQELRQLDRLASDDVRIVAARARLELALGRPQQAWRTIAPYATALDAAPAALEVGAEASLAEYAHAGDLQAARQAVAMAGRLYERVGTPQALFLTWRAALHARQPDELDRIAAHR